MVSAVDDETKAEAGRPGRRRRKGGAGHRGTLMRLSPDVHAQLEAEARETGESKVSIVEAVLRRRYARRNAAVGRT